jgi:integrase
LSLLSRPEPDRVQGDSRPAHRRQRRAPATLRPPGITASISPHTLRHFLFTWLKTQGIDDALIQPYSGHATRQSLEIYSRPAVADAQQRYDDVIGDFPV